MSTQIQFDTVACPLCDAQLLTERLDDVAALCANCHTVFVPAGRLTVQRTSRKAVISFVLGLASPIGLFLTGVPAIWLGVLAFRDIRAAPRALKGKYLAVSGIATGTVFGLMFGTCLGLLVALGLAMRQSMTQTEDPGTVAEIADRLPEFDAPHGVALLEGMEVGMFDTRTVVYGGKPRANHPLVIVMQLPQGSLLQQIQGTIENKDGRNGGNLEIVETGELEVTIRDEAVTVLTTVGLDHERGQTYRQYVAEIPSTGPLLFAALVTPNVSDSSSEMVTVALSEDEVVEFFESFR